MNPYSAPTTESEPSGKRSSIADKVLCCIYAVTAFIGAGGMVSSVFFAPWAEPMAGFAFCGGVLFVVEVMCGTFFLSRLME
jgi:hypothetical protein